MKIIHGPPPKNKDTNLPRAVKSAIALERIHRGQDAYVTLHRKLGKWENLKPMRTSEIPELLPGIWEYLEKDSYVGINSHYKPVRRGNTRTLRYINACFSDFDCYGLSPAKALGHLMEKVGDFTIPAPSIFGLSGRGIWAFWLLRDPDDPDMPQKAFPEKRLLFAKVQHAIFQSLKKTLPELCPDANALDANRVTRIPESINSKSNKRVLHFASLTHDGKPRTYKLAELAEHFDVEERPPAPIVRTGKRVPANIAGWDARWKKTWDWFKALRDIRGGFEKGSRETACWIYSFILTRARVPEPEKWERVSRLAEECTPPFSQDEAFSAMVSTQSAKWNPSMKTLAMKLDVTESEAKALACFMPKPRGQRKKKTECQDQIKVRQKRIAEIWLDLKGVDHSDPTVDDVTQVLKDKGFPKASRPTVARDMEALNLIVRKRRPRLKTGQIPLFT